MMDIMEMPNHNPFNKVQEDECSDLNLTSGTNHAFDELRSLKLEMESKGSLLGKTWSELSNIMTRYQARVIQKHEQLENSLTGANHSKLIQIEFELKKCRADNVSLQNNVTELKLNAIEKNAELMRKDNLIQKLQAQMRQETLDYQMEIKTLKDSLEQTKVHTDDQSLIPVSSLPVTSPQLKRRKASKTLVTRPPTDIDLLPWPTYSSPRPPASTSLGLSLCGTNSPLPPSANTEQLQNTSSQKPSTSQLTDQSEMDSSYTDQPFTEPQDDGSGQVFIELAEVDSNSEVEGSVQDASMVSEGMLPEGQEQVDARKPLTPADIDVVPKIAEHRREHKNDVKFIQIQRADFEESEMQCRNTELKPDELGTMNGDSLVVVERWGKDGKKLGLKVIKLEEVDSELLEEVKSESQEEDRNIDVIQKFVATESVEKCAVKDFNCHICDKSFSIHRNLKHHLYVHTGEKPYSCHLCTRSFSQSHRLRSHLLIHSGEKPFSCHICSRPFSRADALKSHMVVHTDEKPHQCQICKKSFSRPSYLKIHGRTHLSGQQRSKS